MKKLELISDFGCPFCWRQHLVLRELRERGARFTLTPIPYMLRADTPMTGKKFSEEETEVYSAQLHRLAEEDPIFKDITFAPLTHTYNTYTAHVLSFGADKKGAYLPFALKVYRAYFEEGKNIGDPQVLKEILKDLGLDMEEIMASVTADTMRAAIHRGFQLRKEYGLSSVPAIYFPKEDIMIPRSVSVEELEPYLK